MVCPGRGVTGREGGRSSASNGIEGARGCTHAAGHCEEEVPTVVHGMRSAGCLAVLVFGLVVVA
jgi:hypothetical protein